MRKRRARGLRQRYVDLKVHAPELHTTTATGRAAWLPLLALAAIGCSACLAGYRWTIDYDYATSSFRSLSDVETRLATEADTDDLIVHDEIARFSFRVEPGSILVSIRNGLSTDLRLDLQDAYYVDIDGDMHKLFVSATQDGHELSANIAPEATLDLFLWPDDWMRDSSDGPSTWRADSPLGGLTVEGSRAKALAARESDIGRSFEIVLPVLAGKHRYVYRFRFTVTELHAKRIWWA